MHAGATAVHAQAHRKSAAAAAVVVDQGSVCVLHVGEDDGPFGLPEGLGDVPVAARRAGSTAGSVKFQIV